MEWFLQKLAIKQKNVDNGSCTLAEKCVGILIDHSLLSEEEKKSQKINTSFGPNLP